MLGRRYLLCSFILLVPLIQIPCVFRRESYTACFHPVTSDPLCEEAEVGNGTMSWRSTLTSLEGDVTCNTDFMYTSVDTTLRCNDNGTWEPPIGQCLQYYWRNVSNRIRTKCTSRAQYNCRCTAFGTLHIEQKTDNIMNI